MILASQSPRRIELMREAGFDIRVHPADIDESPRPHEDPLELVRRLARMKAEAVVPEAETGELVLAADTIVTIDGTVLGKPRDAEDARRMLRLLSGRTHRVATGVCLARTATDVQGELSDSFVAVTDVTFYPLSDDEIDRYVRTGEPLDKAGAYGIQGAGGRLLVHSIAGDYYNVVGLPVAEVARRIARFSTR